MKEIKFKFNDGTKSTVNVDDEFYNEYEKLEIESKRIERKETRRHISMNVFEEQGIEFEDENSNLEDVLIKEDISQKVAYAIKTLTNKQQDLVQKVFFYGMRPSDVAKELGVNKSVISRQLQAIYSHLKKILKNFL